MINISYDYSGVSLEENLTELDFHKETVRNSIVRVAFIDVKVPVSEQKKVLDEVCDFLISRFPKYQFYNRNNCTEIEIDAEQNVQYLKNIQCQIFW